MATWSEPLGSRPDFPDWAADVTKALYDRAHPDDCGCRDCIRSLLDEIDSWFAYQAGLIVGQQ